MPEEETVSKSPYGVAFSFLCEGVTFSPIDQAISIYRLVDRIASPVEPISINTLWYIAELHRNEEISIQEFNSLDLELVVEVRGPSKTIEIARAKTQPFPVTETGSLIQRIIVPLGQTGFGFATYGRYYFEVSFSSPTHLKERMFSAPVDVVAPIFKTPDQIISSPSVTPEFKVKVTHKKKNK